MSSGNCETSSLETDVPEIIGETGVSVLTEMDDSGYRIRQDLQDKFYGELDWTCQV